MKLKILYVEDNEAAIYPIRRIATHFKHELLPAGTVAEGLALLKQQQPDLILADMVLPDGDGIDFIRQARQISASVPIIIVTGLATSGEREACLEAGCTGYYIKPIDTEVLIALFKRYAGEG